MRRLLTFFLAAVFFVSLVVLTAGFADAGRGAEMTFLRQGWDDFGRPLTNGMVIWNQPKPGMFQVTYVLEGAQPNYTYQVGIHLFLKDNENPEWDNFGSEGWENIVPRPEGGSYSCRIEDDGVEYCGTINAWEFGFLTTDLFGDGAVHFNLHPNLGAYEIQFNVRSGTCTEADHSGCGVVFESGGVYTTTETIIIE